MRHRLCLLQPIALHHGTARRDRYRRIAPERMPRWPALLLLGLLLLGGCASYQANRPDVVNRIEALVAAHEYDRALTTLALVKPKHPDAKRLRAWRPLVERKSAAWVDGLIAEARELVAAGQWHNAERRYLEGLAKVPSSTMLVQAHEQFLLRRELHLRSLNLDLNLARGRRLPDEILALEKLVAVTPDDARLGAELAQTRSQAAETVKGLEQCGAEALSLNDYAQATECLSVAEALSPGGRSAKLLATARQRTAQRQTQTRLAQQKRDEQNQARKIDDLTLAYDEALRRDDLVSARDQLTRLAALQPQNSTLERESQRLRARIRARVSKNLEDGRKLYTQGDIEQARSVWLAGLRLDPSNEELKTSVARAERVLNKLRKLSDQNTN